MYGNTDAPTVRARREASIFFFLSFSGFVTFIATTHVCMESRALKNYTPETRTDIKRCTVSCT